MQDQGFSSLISKVIDTKYYKKVSLGTRTDFFCATLPCSLHGQTDLCPTCIGVAERLIIWLWVITPLIYSIQGLSFKLAL